MNVFIVNGHEYWEKSPGRLNKTLTEYAAGFFEKRTYTVRVSYASDAFDAEEEVQKILWADVMFIITPVFWMNVPSTLKAYLDRVYSANKGRFYAAGGRGSSGEYGSGGFLTGKSYMLITTWNARKEDFGNPSQFLFRGKSVDDVFLNIHLMQRYVGMKKLPTFSVHDVIHNPDIRKYLDDFQRHLEMVFAEERDKPAAIIN